MSRKDEIKQGLYDHTVDGHRKDVAQLTEEGLALEMTPLELLFDALIPALQEVGRRFEVGDFFVPEMLMAAKAMQAALNILRPLLAETGAKPVGCVVMLTVRGDLHDIGKNLCSMMLEGAGFEVHDLGVNVSPDKIVAAIQEYDAHIVGMSAFLTTTMPMFRANMDLLEKAGLRDKVRVLVGGAPVTQEFADKIKADGYAADASNTAKLATQIMVDLGYDVTGGQATPEVETVVTEVETLLDKVRETPDDNA